MTTKTYSEMILLPTYEERLEYLRTFNRLGDPTFGYERWLNQGFYRSYAWRHARREAILRDDGCDLGVPGRRILDRIIVHHIQPISMNDIVDVETMLTDLDNLICVSLETHNAIHFGHLDPAFPTPVIDRSPNDTIPWR